MKEPHGRRRSGGAGVGTAVAGRAVHKPTVGDSGALDAEEGSWPATEGSVVGYLTRGEAVRCRTTP
jgi:hypothetical protein